MIQPLAEDIGVSRETFERLTIYADLLRRWNPRINLVSRASLNELWVRHIADSLQIHRLAPKIAGSWVDLGSGGGFPGLVTAIASAGSGEKMDFTMVESDARKSAFLRTVIRETGIHAKVVTNRIESLPPLGADVVSARALADLANLLDYSEPHLCATGTALFPKGETWKKELAEAKKKWQFDAQAVPSTTDSRAVVLIIRGISRV